MTADRILPQPDVFHVTSRGESVHRARERVAAVALAWGIPFDERMLGDVRLCASAVVTNALVHAGGECWVTTTWTGQHLRVAVADLSTRPPVMGLASEDSRSGRGLAIVEDFASAWGWETTDNDKIVFFHMACDAAAKLRSGTAGQR